MSVSSLSPEVYQRILAAPVLEGINPALVMQCLDKINLREVAVGDLLLKEGQPNSKVFIIHEGRADVRKTGENKTDAYTLAQLGPGEEFGEMTLIDGGNASASVIAATPIKLLELDLANAECGSPLATLSEKIRLGIGRRISSRLRDNNRFSVAALEREIEENRLRSVAGFFIVIFASLTALYTIAVKVIFEFNLGERVEAWISPIIAAVFMSAIMLMMKRSPFPFRFFGVTLHGWRASVKDALFWSIVFCIGLTIAKSIWVSAQGLSSVFQVADMFSRYDDNGQLDIGTYALFFVLYAIFCPVQELICRCGSQAPIYALLKGSQRQRHVISILTSNLLFAASHSHLNATFVLATFLPGLFWGWLFTRHKSIVGVSVSHALIGGYALFALGIEEFLK